jgi:ActR/RegA family two-component response regulator
MTNKKVLLVEDEEDILAQFEAKIKKRGYEVLTAQNGAEAWKIFQGTAVLVVVTDIMMPIKDGLQILEEIKKYNPSTRVIIITGFGGKAEAIKALKLDAFDYIEKGAGTTAKDLLSAIERAFQDVDTQVRTEKEMLSFLTHTLFNTISGGPITVEQVLEDAQAALGDRYEESDVYRMINNISSLKAIFLSMANMLRAYRIFVNEPNALEQKWHEDTKGDLSLDRMLSAVLRQTLGSLLFEETNLGQFNRILEALGGRSISTVRETFLKDVFWSETAQHDAAQVLSWCERYFPIITLEIDGPTPVFNATGVRYPFLFSIFSEIIYNALKYTDCREPIRVGWGTRAGSFAFTCSNTFGEASTRWSGAQKGLAFVNGLSRMIEGIHLIREDDHNVFKAELHVRESLLN